MEGSAQQPIKSFKDLRVWQAAYKLAIQIYNLTKAFPLHERYGLSSQMSRSAVSVCSNIAEGFGRRSSREKDQFYSMANGSLTELENQLLIARGVGYVQERQFQTIAEQCSATHRMLATLQKVNFTKGTRSKNSKF